jgi:hypothetical protein
MNTNQNNSELNNRIALTSPAPEKTRELTLEDIQASGPLSNQALAEFYGWMLNAAKRSRAVHACLLGFANSHNEVPGLKWDHRNYFTKKGNL